MEDITQLIDELESEFAKGKNFLWSKKSFVNLDKCEELIAELKQSLPSSLQEASYVLSQRDKIISQAKEQADKFNWERNYNILVPFKDVDRVKPTKKMQNLKDRIKKEEDKLYNHIEKTDCQNYKSKYIGCPQCGSKINKEYIHNSRCPLCKEDLRSDTTKKTIERYKNNITKVRKEFRVEKEKLSSKAKTKYLLLFEEYCG